MYDPLLFILILCNTYICNTMNQDNQKKKKFATFHGCFEANLISGKK